MKVKSSATSLIHFNAWCTACEWHYQDYLTPSKGHHESKVHVSQTGHSVHVEEGLVTVYSTQQEGKLTMREADVSEAVGPVVRITDEDIEAINYL